MSDFVFYGKDVEKRYVSLCVEEFDHEYFTEHVGANDLAARELAKYLIESLPGTALETLAFALCEESGVARLAAQEVLLQPDIMGNLEFEQFLQQLYVAAREKDMKGTG